MEILDIRNVNGHYEAYLYGKFVCSGDTQKECENEAIETVSKMIETIENME